MIPPGSVIQDPERAGKENEAEQRGTPQSPGSGGQHESKLQRLKRSLSFKAKSLRSKSADNFFQRASGDVRLQVDLLPEVSPGGLGPAPLPVPGCSPGRLPRPPEGAAHSFLEHIFKKPTFCDICNHMIVGTTAKHGLRCKACKMSIHHKCMDGVGQQRCMGKLPKGFRRYYSSPLLIQEQFGCIKEVMPIACGSKVDPVYEALRFGTSLAQKTKRTSVGSGSESPHRSSRVERKHTSPAVHLLLARLAGAVPVQVFGPHLGIRTFRSRMLSTRLLVSRSPAHRGPRPEATGGILAPECGTSSLCGEEQVGRLRPCPSINGVPGFLSKVICAQ
ncbi:hypothetical protein Z043_117807 [Scleropages formosus]|uniref:Phorbol-ester/DAG-type domain-containing protein n=1 Tax=Scleropages formosus TaxID=113540 RepID=A0A0P7WQN5_SCLFO|nr:hypothetical protein Z043_117807 [Scleropages formosus]